MMKKLDKPKAFVTSMLLTYENISLTKKLQKLDKRWTNNLHKPSKPKVPKNGIFNDL